MEEHPAGGPLQDPASGEERTVMVFIRDTKRDLGFGYKTRGSWRGGVFDPSLWAEGDNRCDCARARLVYRSGEYPCGTTRFVIERVVTWDTGDTVYSECGHT
jgi:hypothetical protein